MTIIPGNAQHVGARKNQQDSFAISTLSDPDFISHAGVLAIVADGMGGLAEGSKASNLAVKSFMEAYCGKLEDESISTALDRSIFAANKAVYTLSLEIEQKGNCGTTLIAAVIHKSGLYWIYAGDSHIYLKDELTLKLLTEDHIYAKNLDKAAAKGLIDLDTAQNHPEREALTSYIGDESIHEVGRGFLSGPLQEGATLLLCSDGLYKFISEDSVMETYSDDPNLWAKRLVDLVISKNYIGQDNITVVCLRANGHSNPVDKYNLLISLKRKHLFVLSGFSLLLICALVLFYMYLGTELMPQEHSKSSDDVVIYKTSVDSNDNKISDDKVLDYDAKGN